MANKAKAMLDALMGPSRDVSRKDKTNDEFRDRKVCKHFLVGCCPNSMLGKKVEAIRRNPALFCISPGVVFDKASVLNPEGCTNLHSPGLKVQLNEHPKADKYRAEYEDDLRSFLKQVISEADRTAQKVKDKHEHIKEREGTSGLGRDPDADKLCETCGMRYTLKRKECGIGHQDFHAESEVHVAYTKLRTKLSGLESKVEEKKAAEDAKAEEDKAKREQRAKERAEGKQNEDRASRSRSKRRDVGNDDRERRRSGSRRGNDRQPRANGDRGDRDAGAGRDRRHDDVAADNGERGDRDSGRSRDRRHDDVAAEDGDRASARSRGRRHDEVAVDNGDRGEPDSGRSRGRRHGDVAAEDGDRDSGRRRSRRHDDLPADDVDRAEPDSGRSRRRRHDDGDGDDGGQLPPLVRRQRSNSPQNDRHRARGRGTSDRDQGRDYVGHGDRRRDVGNGRGGY